MDTEIKIKLFGDMSQASKTALLRTYGPRVAFIQTGREIFLLLPLAEATAMSTGHLI